MRARATAALLTLALTALARPARSDPPGDECWHSVPARGSACARPPSQPCTYTDPRGTTICTCRTDGQWFCEPLPAPPPPTPPPRGRSADGAVSGRAARR